jgi:hypothetical protein
MATTVLSPPPLDSELTCVLAAYSAAQPVVATDVADDQAVGWIPRLAIVEQVSPERLAPVHGKLIALGLLRFQLLDRTGGMVYRLSPEGRSALSAATGQAVPTLPESTDGPGDGTSLDVVLQATDETAVEAAA